MVNGIYGGGAVDTGRQEKPGPRIKLLGKPAARPGKACRACRLDSTACHQPGKVELRMYMEQDQKIRRAEGGRKSEEEREAAQQQTPGEITSSPHRFVIVS